MFETCSASFKDSLSGLGYMELQSGLLLRGSSSRLSFFFFFFFLISQKGILLKKRKAPQKYIGYIQEELLARKRKAGKKIRITKRQKGQVSCSPRIQGIQQRG
jgi:hypothetical protein